MGHNASKYVPHQRNSVLVKFYNINLGNKNKTK